jgi:transcriptional regulator GlxA family with amidase domain
MSLDEVRSYIDRNFASPLTIMRLASMAGLSPFYFIRSFRSATGLTPHQYVRAKRIERAQELLVTTPLPVTEICDAVGFQSLGSFSATFRRLTGRPPAHTAPRGERVLTYRPASFACTALTSNVLRATSYVRPVTCHVQRARACVL